MDALSIYPLNPVTILYRAARQVGGPGYILASDLIVRTLSNASRYLLLGKIDGPRGVATSMDFKSSEGGGEPGWIATSFCAGRRPAAAEHEALRMMREAQARADRLQQLQDEEDGPYDDLDEEEDDDPYDDDFDHSEDEDSYDRGSGAPREDAR